MRDAPGDPNELDLSGLDADRLELFRLLLDEEAIHLAGAAHSLRQTRAPSSFTIDEVIDRVAAHLRPAEGHDLLLYLHVPFCSSKCTFCDWVAEIPTRELRARGDAHEVYTDALCRQIASLGGRLGRLGYTPKYIYWGGGTPSALAAEQLTRIIGRLHEEFDLSGVVEHSLEASPETLTLPKLRSLRAAGVNRISMGVQSFDDRELRRGARAHSAEEAVAAVEMMRNAGFENFNIDLIAGLPGQDEETLRRTLRKAIDLAPPHITVYVYRAQEKTVLAQQVRKGVLPGVGAGGLRDRYVQAKAALEAGGYREYTLGYFARANHYHFRGEQYYFNFEGEFVGFGSGAHSFLGHHYVEKRVASPQAFAAAPLQFDSCERFSPAALKKNLLVPLGFALLTETGLDFGRFERLVGFPFAAIRSSPDIMTLLKYFEYCGARFEEDSRGLRVSEETRRVTFITALARSFSRQGESPS